MVASAAATQLLNVLRQVSGHDDLEFAGPPEHLTGGFWAELIAFSLRNPPEAWPTDLVARLMPDEALACKETIVQSAVAGAGYPTPAVRVEGDASSGLGRAFMVMDRVPGRPLLDGLDGLAALSSAPRLMREISEQLAMCMATLHALDAAPVAARLSESGYGGATGIEGMLDGLAVGARLHGRSDLEAAAEALGRKHVSGQPAVICHGDLHPFNLLVGKHGEATVLDWSASLLAPREYDVAFTSLLLSEPPLAVPRPLRTLVRAIGRRLSSRFVRSYERHAKLRIDPVSLRHYQAIVCLRALVEVAGWVAGGDVDNRGGHPWLVNGESFAARLSSQAGLTVRAR